ncbi:RHS repeat-associated core domain-containing protein [Streptomyces ficellus]|uniref:RHS repeat-associated core domain-containing protein n=1 Tax=Streptomyces ficellus TaxID=1977088 RepID=UPI003EB8C2D9
MLHFTTIHGDVALQLPLDASVAPTALDTDEYGNARAGQQVPRYGWLGAKQRTAETVTGQTLMGIRLYAPATGRFLSVDPVFGGGDNRNRYPGDPVNKNDLDGRKWKCNTKCQLAGHGSHCTGYIWGAGSGHSQEGGRPGRQARHRAPGSPRLLRPPLQGVRLHEEPRPPVVRQQQQPAQHPPPQAANWMRSANHNSWGILFHSEVWRAPTAAGVAAAPDLPGGRPTCPTPPLTPTPVPARMPTVGPRSRGSGR